MTKKTRLIILLVCVACFLIIAPILVAYSEGYRFDFKKMEITATGGIYVRTFPAADKITIDSTILEKPGMFSNSIFVQSLLPENHTISIKKSDYYDYFKTLPVQKKQVTKLENVLLFKKNITFQTTTDKTQSPFNKIGKFIIKNNNLYYSSATENSALTATQKATPIFKNLVAFYASGNNIIWLGVDGFLYQSDLTTPSAKPAKLTLTALKINKKSSYKIVSDSQNIFVVVNGNLLSFNAKINNLDNFYSPVTDATISPDGKNIIYFNDSNVYISLLSGGQAKQNILYKSSVKISSALWINNDYIFLTNGDKIIISEIDYRGNINTITLPQTITIAGQKIDIKNPEIYFDQSTGKLYILTGKSLLLSEKITP